MKIIFIGGPFRGDGNVETKKNNIEIARKFVHIFIENGIPFYSPHLNIDQEMILFPIEKDPLAYELNGEFLKKCDALAVLPGWETSIGTKQEIENAKKYNIPIFYLSNEGEMKKITDWIKTPQ
jgi:hypothetical protein